MKKRKSLLALLMSLVLCISMLGTTALAKADTGIMPYGTYLSYGTSTISYSGGSVVTAYGSTTCYRVCDKVEVEVYLYQYRDGNWHYYDSWSGVGYNTNFISLERNIAVPTGHYYYVTCSHFATKGSTMESNTSYSRSLYVG